MGKQIKIWSFDFIYDETVNSPEVIEKGDFSIILLLKDKTNEIYVFNLTNFLSFCFKSIGLERIYFENEINLKKIIDYISDQIETNLTKIRRSEKLINLYISKFIIDYFIELSKDIENENNKW